MKSETSSKQNPLMCASLCLHTQNFTYTPQCLFHVRLSVDRLLTCAGQPLRQRSATLVGPGDRILAFGQKVCFPGTEVLLESLRSRSGLVRSTVSKWATGTHHSFMVGMVPFLHGGSKCVRMQNIAWRRWEANVPTNFPVRF